MSTPIKYGLELAARATRLTNERATGSDSPALTAIASLLGSIAISLESIATDLHTLTEKMNGSGETKS